MATVTGRPLYLVALFMVHLCVTPESGHAVGEENSYPLGEEKVSHLHFFFHDTVGGRNQTAVKVAQPTGTSLPFFFGDVLVIDDPLTTGVDPASEVVGNAQGIYAYTGREKLSLFMAVDIGFTTGEFNGSSISVVSRNPVTETSRELAVVGGRGQFRLARGFALLTTRKLEGTVAILEYNVTVLHY